MGDLVEVPSWGRFSAYAASRLFALAMILTGVVGLLRGAVALFAASRNLPAEQQAQVQASMEAMAPWSGLTILLGVVVYWAGRLPRRRSRSALAGIAAAYGVLMVGSGIVMLSLVSAAGQEIGLALVRRTGAVLVLSGGLTLAGAAGIAASRSDRVPLLHVTTLAVGQGLYAAYLILGTVAPRLVGAVVSTPFVDAVGVTPASIPTVRLVVGDLATVAFETGRIVGVAGLVATAWSRREDVAWLTGGVAAAVAGVVWIAPVPKRLSRIGRLSKLGLAGDHPWLQLSVGLEALSVIAVAGTAVLLVVAGGAAFVTARRRWDGWPGLRRGGRAEGREPEDRGPMLWCEDCGALVGEERPACPRCGENLVEV